MTSLSFPSLSAFSTTCPPPSSGTAPTDTCYTSNNDETGVSTGSLSIDDGSPYYITGNGITLGAGGITASTTNTSPSGSPYVGIPITLGAPQTGWSISAPSGAFGQLDLEGQVTGTGDTLPISLDNASLALGQSSPVDDEVGTVNVTGNTTGFSELDLGPGSSLNGTYGDPVSFSGGAGLYAGPNSSIGQLSMSGGQIQIGDPFAPAILSVNGTGTMDSASTLLEFITGTGNPAVPGTDNSELSASGNTTVGGQLAVIDQTNSGACRPLPVGDTYTLVTTSGSLGPGTFNNAPTSGSTISANCSGTPPTLTINYTSNSVTATVETAGSSTTSTTTALSANPQSTVTNQTTTLTASVASTGGGPNPTDGTVDFTDNNNQISGCSSQPVDSNGNATCQTSFPAGSQNLVATYNPSNSSNFSSSSGNDQMTVSKDSTTTTLSASNSSPSEGQSVTYTATVTPGHAGSTEPSGTVEFLDGSSPISGCSSQPLTQGSSSSTATCTTSYSASGSHSITASYGGDSNFTGSTSSAQTVTVQSPPPPPPPPPAISATTQPANPVGTATSTLHGVISTQGKVVTWQFQYGESTDYNKATPIQTISAGQNQPVAVAWKLINLQPLTVYHFRLVAITQAGSGQSPVYSYGQDLTFTTRSTGSLLLTFASLKVIGGFVSVPLKCSSKLKCIGRFSITTKTKVGKPGHRHLGSVLCNTTFFKLAAGKITRVTAKIYPACLSLLRHARGHQIKAQFTSRPRTGQFGIIKYIFLHL